MNTPTPVRRTSLIDALEIAASEALTKVRHYRMQGNLTIASIYADLAETRTAHLKLLLLEQTNGTSSVLPA
jgi:hypothetical protein